MCVWIYVRFLPTLIAVITLAVWGLEQGTQLHPPLFFLTKEVMLGLGIESKLSKLTINSTGLIITYHHMDLSSPPTEDL